VSNLRRHLKSCGAKFENLAAPERVSREDPSWVAVPTQDLESDGDEDPPLSESSQLIVSPLAKKRRLTTSLEGVFYQHDQSTAAEPRSYTISAFDLSNQTLSNPHSSLELADVSAAPQFVLDLATSTVSPIICHASVSGSASLKSGLESNAVHARSSTASDVRQRRAPERRHPTHHRWIPRSLRKFVNSSRLVSIPEDSSPLSTPAAARLAEPVSSSSSSLDSSRRREEETAENARCAFIRSVPPHLVLWVQIPLPPVSPGWTSTLPPPSVPSYDVIHAEHAKLRQSNLETDDRIRTVTQTTNMSYTTTIVHSKPITGSWASQMEAQAAMNVVTSQKASSSSSSTPSFLHSYSATKGLLPSRSDNPASASPQSSDKLSMMNLMPYFEERDSYYDPTPSGGTTEQQLAARYPYHPAAWLGRLPGPGLSDAEQSMLKMRLLERRHV
jgi:hypothetical protein